jgi:hypothetical protein
LVSYFISLFWNSYLRKEDLLTIFEPLRPGVDIYTTVNDESSIWRGWILNLAAYLADDVFAYYVSQQKMGQEIVQAVLDRYIFSAHDSDLDANIPPGLQSIPTRGTFKLSVSEYYSIVLGIKAVET